MVVEKKYEPLREKLRTSADNLNRENPVVNELQEEVLLDLKNVSISSFINTKNISFKIAASIFLSFAIVLLTVFNLYIIDISKFLGNIPDIVKNSNLLKRTANTPIGEINESQDIYGNSKLVALGDKEVNIKIKPVNYEVNVREEGDAEKKQFDEIFPSDVNVKQSSALEEHIPEEQQELVKNYFNKIAIG